MLFWTGIFIILSKSLQCDASDLRLTDIKGYCPRTRSTDVINGNQLDDSIAVWFTVEACDSKSLQMIQMEVSLTLWFDICHLTAFGTAGLEGLTRVHVLTGVQIL